MKRLQTKHEGRKPTVATHLAMVSALVLLASSPAQRLLAQKPAAADFEIRPVDGVAVSGRLAGIQKPWHISLQTPTRPTWNGEDLISIARKEHATVLSPSGSQVLLANGDRLRAMPHSATQEVLNVHSELLGELEIPLERVQAFLLNPPPSPKARETLIKRLTREQRKRDVVILGNGDEPAGSFTGMDGNTIRLEGANGPIEISRTGVVAVALSSDLISFPRPRGLYAKAFLADGSELALLEGWTERANFHGNAAFEREVSMPLEQLVALEFRNGRLTFLSDLDPLEYRHTPYLGVRYPYERDRSVLRNELMLRGQVFHKGLGVHSRSELTYALDGRYRKFEARVGIDDETGGDGSVVFRVLLDGNQAWESQAITGHSAALPVEIEVRNARRLTLIADFGPLGDVQDHADWAEARLSR